MAVAVRHRDRLMAGCFLNPLMLAPAIASQEHEGVAIAMPHIFTDTSFPKTWLKPWPGVEPAFAPFVRENRIRSMLPRALERFESRYRIGVQMDGPCRSILCLREFDCLAV
jgi:hypothetical protein